ncbi:hypothetical protein Sste5346_006230 [Sporothrix stenoceras]|uniref:DUF7136 domain-containing protein n=1 Tax=Sporothrix stenoceras TaxID=5173 RepID=A0ABR3Z0I9_9PEZI
MRLSVLAWFSVAYCTLTGPVVSTRADTAAIAPGVVNLDLIFPLNNTYAPFDGPMPIVFGVSRPDIASVLQLKVSYLLSDEPNTNTVYGTSQVFDLSSGSIPSTKNNGNGGYAFFVNFSNASIVGQVGKFRTEITFVFVVDYPGDEKTKETIVPQPLIYDMFFTTVPGAVAAIVPGMEATNSSNSRSNNTTPCMNVGAGSFYFPINITDFITNDGTEFGVISTDRTHHFPSQCAVEVDADTAATIAAGPTTATASGTGTTSSATNTSTANSTPAKMLPSGFVTASVIVAVLYFSMFGGALLL